MEKSNVWDIGNELAAESELGAGTSDVEAGVPAVDNAAVIAELIAKTAHRCGAPFEPEALHALLALRARDLAGWMDVRATLKRVNGDPMGPVAQDRIGDRMAAPIPLHVEQSGTFPVLAMP
jgi:hypothetical protein